MPPATSDSVTEPLRPLVSRGKPHYLSAISIKGVDTPFHLLEPVAVRRQGEVLADLQALNELAGPGGIEPYVARDVCPLPMTADREGYHGDRHFDWWLSGLSDYLNIRRAMHRHGSGLGRGDVVLDLGCASGRVLRHFSVQGESLDCWGVDINLRHIEWIRLFLDPRIKLIHSTILPHLPIEDRSVDLLTAFSVFTHIDDLELAWLAELRRVLKPGGFAYVTIHSQHTWSGMRPGIAVYDVLLQMREHIADYQVSPSFLAGPLPRVKTVLAWDTAQNYNAQVFHHTDYIVREWGRFLDVLEILPKASGYQDVVVLRRRRERTA